MDQATQRARAKAKAFRKQQLRDGNSLRLVESKGLGKKNKRAETFPTKCCEYRIDGRQVAIKKLRTKKGVPVMVGGKPDYYSLMVVVGGRNCHSPAIMKGRCLEHLSATYSNE